MVSLVLRHYAYIRTAWEGAFPCPQVLRDLWHFYVGIELFYLVQDCVFIIVAEIII